MGIRSTSTRRITAKSAQSGDATVIYSGATNTYTVAGAASSQISTGGSGTGPTISGVVYTDQNYNTLTANAAATVYGYAKILGSGFASGANIFMSNTTTGVISNITSGTTFINSGEIRANILNATAGNYSLYMFNAGSGIGGSGAIFYSGITFEPYPIWNGAVSSLSSILTVNISLGSYITSVAAVQPITFTLSAGNTLPSGLSLASNGVISGTVTQAASVQTYYFYVNATDLYNETTTSSNIALTLSGVDQYWPNTTLALNSEIGVTPFINDASTNNFALNIFGDVKADKFSPYYGDGYYSTYLSTTSTGFTNSSVSHGLSANFTIEFWHYPTVSMASGTFYYLAGATTGPLIAMNGGVVSFAHQGSFTVNGTTGVVQGQWNHIACVRSSGTVTVYLNGNYVGSGADASNFSTAQTYGYGVSNAGSSGVAGYISNFRIIDGQSLYSGNFTPSTVPLTTSAVGATGANVAASLTGTVTFLGFQSSRFLDKSASNTALTLAGAPAVSPAIPFAASSNYSTYGSLYVPSAATNYLALPHTATTTITSGSTDSFIAEFWMYCNSVTASISIIDQSGVNSVTFQNWSLGFDGSKKIQLIWGATGSPGSQNGILSGSTIFAAGVWYHIAFVKTNADWAVFVNGTREITYNGLNTASDGTSNPLRIGSDSFSSQSINGYIADLRIYKGASAGAPYAATSTTITVPTTPLTAITNTQLLTCQYNGGANNYGIIDNSPFDNVINRVANSNVSQGTFSPYSPNGWSNFFNGSSDYLTVTGSTAFNANSTGSLTVEAWIYMTGNAGGTRPIVMKDWSIGTTFPSFGFAVASTNKLQFGIGSGTTSSTGYQQIDGSATLSLHTWYHVAAVISGSSYYLFINGQQDVTGSFTGTVGVSSNPIYVGTTGNGYYFTGYISNLRITKSALYTVAFPTSTAPLTAVTNTQLLTAQNNRFKDNSTNAFVMTPGGTPSVQASSPFTMGVNYIPSLHGGSAFFDGSGDYITSPYSLVNELASGNFTIELWVYRNSIGAQHYLVHNRPTSSSTGWGLNISSSNTLNFYFTAGGSLNSTVTILANSWYHIAAVNVGGTMSFYINGVKDTSGSVGSGNASTGTNLFVGCDNGPTFAAFFPGYISDLRITKAALYTGTSFSLPTTPLTVNTSVPPGLLLNFTNTGIIDAHASNVLETVGGAQLSTNVKKFGATSMSFSGSSQYTVVSSSSVGPNFAFGTGDFTIEFWVYLNSVSGGAILFDGRPASTNGFYPTIYVPSGATTTVAFLTNSADRINSAASTIITATWYHIALSRSAGNTRLYVNGNQAGSTYPDTNTYLGGTNRPVIAASGYDLTGNMNGYIDDLRITKGIGRYTGSSFTLPSTTFLTQ